MTLKGRHFLSLKDFNRNDILKIIDKSIELKNIHVPKLKNRTIGLLFQKPSTRTRISFQVAVSQLGGQSIYLNWNDLQLGRNESIRDTAEVLSRYIDGLVARLYSHKDMIELSKYAKIPIINGLTDMYHPCQILGDLITIIEHKGDLKSQKIVFVGDGNNVSNSLLIASSILGLETTLICPKGYEPAEEVQNEIKKHSDNKILITNDLNYVKEATVIYTDVWVSMGQEKEREKRLKAFKSYRVDEELVKKADSDFIFMHCLPRTSLEVSDGVFYGEHSVVWDQAENRLHAQKGLLYLLF
ncbi:MAG: ornithine carbamoyltransferase [Candidatus Odinarchaeia archaeon]